MSTRLVYRREKPYPRHKVRKINELVEYFRKYRNILLVGIRDVNANQMKELRRKLWNKALVKVVKNTLTEIALEKVKKERPELTELVNFLDDMHAIIFTNDDIFEISKTVDSIKEKRTLKPGKISPIDVVVKKGFTGFRPGPEMSEMRMAGVPVRIFDGEVFVMEDYTLVKAGQVVSPYAARVMALLDIKPLEVGPEVIVGITDGYIIPKDILLKPLESYLEELQKAIVEARMLALESRIPIPEVFGDLLAISVREATLLATEAAFITDDTIPDLLSMTTKQVIVLLNRIYQITQELPEDLRALATVKAEAPKAPSEEIKKEKEEKKVEEEKKKEEEAGLAGLQILFQ